MRPAFLDKWTQMPLGTQLMSMYTLDCIMLKTFLWWVQPFERYAPGHNLGFDPANLGGSSICWRRQRSLGSFFQMSNPARRRRFLPAIIPSCKKHTTFAMFPWNPNLWRWPRIQHCLSVSFCSITTQWKEKQAAEGPADSPMTPSSCPKPIHCSPFQIENSPTPACSFNDQLMGLYYTSKSWHHNYCSWWCLSSQHVARRTKTKIGCSIESTYVG